MFPEYFHTSGDVPSYSTPAHSNFRTQHQNGNSGGHSLRLGRWPDSMFLTIFSVHFFATSSASLRQVIPKRSKTSFRLDDLLLFQKKNEVIPTSSRDDRSPRSLKLDFFKESPLHPLINSAVEIIFEFQK